MLHLDVGQSSVESLVVGHREKSGQAWLNSWLREKELGKRVGKINSEGRRVSKWTLINFVIILLPFLYPSTVVN